MYWIVCTIIGEVLVIKLILNLKEMIKDFFYVEPTVDILDEFYRLQKIRKENTSGKQP
jgi:hypothetical protein